MAIISLAVFVLLALFAVTLLAILLVPSYSWAAVPEGCGRS